MGGEGTVCLHPALKSVLLLAGRVCQKHFVLESKQHFELERFF